MKGPLYLLVPTLRVGTVRSNALRRRRTAILRNPMHRLDAERQTRRSHAEHGNERKSHDFGYSVLLAFMLTGTAFGAVKLVRDGVAVSEIVIAKDAVQGVKLAAEDLQKHLELISGAKLPIVNAPSVHVKNQVYVGESEFTRRLGFKPAEFNSSGLEIVAKDNYVILDGPTKHWKPSPYNMTVSDYRYLRGSIITGKTYPKPEDFPSPGLKAWQDFCGEKFTTKHINNGPGRFNKPLGIHVNDDIGAWHAVAELLEQLGVRWYMPYENGTVIPEKTTIAIPDQHLKKEAKYPRREWCYYKRMEVDAEGVAWLKRLKAGNNRIIVYNHTTYAIYSSYEQQKRHPEWLARDSKGQLIEGYPSGCGAPRYTHPGFRQAAVTFMNKVLESQPDLWAMAVGPPDGGIKVDARDIGKYGKPTDTVPQKASNYVWDFHVHLAKALKESHPDKFLLYMSGAGGRELPTNIEEFPDNLLVPPKVTNAYMWGLDVYRRASLDAVGKWVDKMKVVRRAPSWDHWLMYRRPSRPRYPVVFTKALKAQMKEMLPYIDGKFIEIQPDGRRDAQGRTSKRLGVIGLVHLMVYWQNELFWDPDADRTKMLDEYYMLFFGPAETEMREFYEFAEKVWMRQESRTLTEHTGFLKEADVDRYFEILVKARAKAGKGSVYDKRIAMIEGDMQSLKKLFPNLKRTGPWFRVYPAPESFKIDGDPSEYKYGWTTLGDWTTGERPEKNVTRAVVTMTPNKSGLIVGAVCYENRMDNIKADCKANDDFGIFNDDVVEVYINTPERSYFKIVVNPNVAVWTESTDVAIIDRDTLPILWNPGVKAAVEKHADRWTVEIMVPTRDFGELGPTKEYPWGIQVGRTRFTGGHMQPWALAPTSGGPYKTLNRWGSLWMK